MASIERVRALLSRFLSGELDLGSAIGSEALLDLLYDPEDWSAELLADVATLRPLLRPPAVHTGVVRFERPTVVPGDLVVDGDLECLSHTLVLGDLR